MSFLRKVFGGKKDEKKSTSKEDALKKLRSTEESLKMRRNAMENKIIEKAMVAKSNCISNKKIAMQALKHKQCFEHNLKRIDRTISNISQQRKSLENLKSKCEKGESSRK